MPDGLTRCRHCAGVIKMVPFFGWRHVHRDTVWCADNKNRAEPSR